MGKLELDSRDLLTKTQTGESELDASDTLAET